jgi:general stress protein 26
MGEIKDLTHEEAIKKLKELAEGSDICMFVTHLDKLPLTSRPMSTQEVDEEGNIWFFSRKSSDKNREIESDPRVQLFYGSTSNYEFLSVYGEASIIIDKEKSKELFDSSEKAWFKEGVDDPELTLVKVVPHDSYYWDNKSNKFVALLKYAASAVTGKQMDDGIEGELHV